MKQRARIKQAASSPMTLGAGLYLNCAAAIVGALSTALPGLRGTMPWWAWLTGLAVVAGGNVVLHTLRERAA